MHGERITCEGREEKIREEMKGAKFRRKIKVKGETWKVQMVLRRENKMREGENKFWRGEIKNYEEK